MQVDHSFDLLQSGESMFFHENVSMFVDPVQFLLGNDFDGIVLARLLPLGLDHIGEVASADVLHFQKVIHAAEGLLHFHFCLLLHLLPCFTFSFVFLPVLPLTLHITIIHFLTGRTVKHHSFILTTISTFF